MSKGVKVTTALCLGWMIVIVAIAVRATAAPQGRKDYLSSDEADKIRDIQDPGARIKLYLTFAEDRLKKFDYEQARTAPETDRGAILNGLLNGYDGCVEDAADEIDEAKDRQMNIHPELKLLESKGKDFLAELQKIDKAKGPNYDDYNDTLQDAIDDTKDAISDAQSALKEMLPAPVRRKQD
ncbi:MAG TPA: hypothetical protein VGR36_04745 [Candidatus Acidoferrales bacterium]|nr:hypothetical protein [Candidatus Acidoferrales bacterium]